jgi:hypothetical protein
MAYAATAGGVKIAAPAAPGVLALQRALVWLVGASGAIVFIEPSPYEIVTLLATVAFFATGLRLRLALMPLLLMLVLLNVGYTISAIPLFEQPEVVSWIATSWYMAVTVVFFAMITSEDTAARLDMLRRGLVVGAMVASLAAVAGYFHLVPGGDDLLTLYGRARGTFKDPNVLGAFLILPALFALQSVVSDKLAKAFRNVIAFGIMSLAILLAFSRAAWGGLVLTSAFMLALMVLTSRTNAQRSRIVVMAIVAAVLGLALIAVLLSFDSTAEMFKQRASFDGARPAIRHRPPAIPPLLPRGHPQLLSQRLHVRRLALRRVLSRAGLHHRDHGLPAHLRPCALAACLYRGLLRLRRHRRRKLRDRHRPLAALLDDAGRDVGHDRSRAGLQG